MQQDPKWQNVMEMVVVLLFPEQETKLTELFRRRRKKGRKTSGLWFKLQFKRSLIADKPKICESPSFQVMHIYFCIFVSVILCVDTWK